jgi:ubiquinone/menaquinone biosynthesis C-methylase UbiE
MINKAKLLEVGCGTAYFTKWFEEIGLEVIGIDISKNMLLFGRKHWNGDLIQGSSFDLPFRQKSLDFVAFITSLEFMSNPIQIIKEANRIARKGILFGLLNSWSVMAIKRRIQMISKANSYYKNVHFYSIIEVKKILKSILANRSYSIKWRSTILPSPFNVPISSTPFGAFLGIMVQFHKNSYSIRKVDK